MNFKRKQEYFADYDKCSDGSFKVRLRIVEPEQEVVEVILTLPTRELALSVCENGAKKPPPYISRFTTYLLITDRFLVLRRF